MRSPFIVVALSMICSLSAHAAGDTNRTARLPKDELEAVFPRKLEGLEMEGGVFQSCDNVVGTGWGYNRCQRIYSDNKKHRLSVEVRDTGGFTKEFIAHCEYLHLPVGAKDINKQTITLINGRRGLIYSEKGDWENIVLIAALDRFEIEVKDSAGIPVEKLKAIALQFEAALKKKTNPGGTK